MEVVLHNTLNAHERPLQSRVHAVWNTRSPFREGQLFSSLRVQHRYRRWLRVERIACELEHAGPSVATFFKSQKDVRRFAPDAHTAATEVMRLADLEFLVEKLFDQFGPH